MASHRLEIRKQYGNFFAAFGPVTRAPEEKKFGGLSEVIEFVRSQGSKLELEEDDSVIFRGIAYSSLGELIDRVRDGSY